MPKIAEIDGVAIKMYFRDHNPAHVRAIFGDAEAVLSLPDGAVLEGVLPPAKLGVAQRYVVANADALSARWLELKGGEP